MGVDWKNVRRNEMTNIEKKKTSAYGRVLTIDGSKREKKELGRPSGSQWGQPRKVQPSGR